MARYIVGAKPGEQVDHINGNTLDNRKANLRLCSNAQNAMNTKASKDNVSGFKGVSRTRGIRRPWWAKIWTNGKGIFLGAYATAEEAARAYDAAAVEMFGEFARTNFPVPGREDRMKTAKDYAMHIKAGDDPVVVLQVAMSAAESSALGRAAQVARPYSYSAEREIRALIPPAAAPAAETGTCKNFWHPGHGDEIHARREAVGDLSAPHADHVNDSGCLNWKPAAETGKAQGASDLLSEAEDGLADALEAEMKYRRQRDDQTANFHAGRGCVYRWLIPMLRARAAPSEREGK